MATRNRILVILCPLVVFMSFIQSARAAVIEGWVQRYNNVVSNSSDGAFKVVIDQAGDIIVAGYGDDGITEPYLLTIKYSGTDGSLIWQKRYHSPGRTMDPAGIAVDSRANVVVTAYSPFARDTNLISYIAKYAAADGALLWEQIGPVGGGWEHPIAVDSNDNVLVARRAAGVAKYAASGGRLLWEKPYDGTPKAISIDGSGNAILTGTSGTDTNSDFYTAKYAAVDGSLVWEQHYNGPGNASDSPYSVAIDAIGNAVVTGSSGGIEGNADYYTAKVRGSGWCIALGAPL